MTHYASPYMSVYKRNGDTFAKLPDPAVLPSGEALSCVFSDDGAFLVVACTYSPYMRIYRNTTIAEAYKIAAGGFRQPNLAGAGMALGSAAAGQNVPINLFPPINDAWGFGV